MAGIQLRKAWEEGDELLRWKVGTTDAHLLHVPVDRSLFRRVHGLRLRQERAATSGGELPAGQKHWADIVARETLRGWEGVEVCGGGDDAPFSIDAYLAGFDPGYQLAYAVHAIDAASQMFTDLLAATTKRLADVEPAEEVREGNGDSGPTPSGDGTETPPTTSEPS